MYGITKFKIMLAFFLCAIAFIAFVAHNAATITFASACEKAQSVPVEPSIQDNSANEIKPILRRVIKPMYRTPGYRIKIEYFGPAENVEQNGVFSEMIKVLNELNKIFSAQEQHDLQNETPGVNYTIINEVSNKVAEPVRPVKVLPL